MCIRRSPAFPPACGIRYGADTSGLTSENAPEFIRKRAYQFFEMRGRQPGYEVEDWLQAEREVRSRLGRSGIYLTAPCAALNIPSQLG